MQALPSYEDFRGVVGSTFVVAAVVDDSEQVFELDLVLHSVSDRLRIPGGVTYSLEFRGPPDVTFEQGLASLDHARFGRIDLFLVPIGPAGGRMAYEAVFALLDEYRS